MLQPTDANGTSPEKVPIEAIFSIFNGLADDISKLHESGHIHGSICFDSIGWNQQRPVLPPTIGDDALLESDEGLPPELLQQGIVKLPRKISEAKELLTQHGVLADPRRIDVFQLGVVLCYLVGASTLSAYLRSPKLCSQIGLELRLVIDGALGYDPNNRFTTVAELVNAFSAALRPQDRANDLPPRGSAAVQNDTSKPRLTPLGQGDRIGDYEIIERIGSGGMGDVFKGFDPALDRTVAIKVLPSEFARHEDFVERFRDEAKAVAKLLHPNIVQVYSFGQDHGQHFFVMQYVPGESLAEVLSRRGKLGSIEAIEIVEPCLQALAAAHDQGWVHRDVKPSNILLERDSNHVLLADFGLAKTLDQQRRTATGVVMGTVDYLAPEQCRGQSVDIRADLYAIGVLTYELLSGRLPFEAESAESMLFQHAYEQPMPIREAAPDVPRQLADIVTRLMEKDPADRYQTAQEVLAAIAKYRCSRLSPMNTAMPSVDEDNARVAISGVDPDLFTASTMQPLPWRDRLLAAIESHAPDAIKELRSIELQVDGAVAECQQHRNELAQLVCEGEVAVEELTNQANSHRRAAAGAQESKRDQLLASAHSLEQQQIDQEVQLERLKERLLETQSTLKQVRHQRDALKARLKAANLRRGKDPRGARSKHLAVAVVVAICAVAVFGVSMAWFSGSHDDVTVETTERTDETPPAAPVVPRPTARADAYSMEAGSTPESFSENLTRGLVHHWKFDEQAGDLAIDSIGDNNATLVNWSHDETKWTEGRVGGALNFGDGNDYAKTTTSISHKKYTIAFWSNMTGVTGINPRLINPLDSTWIQYGHDKGIDRQGIGFSWYTEGANAPKPPVPNHWEHYAITFDTNAKFATIYRDGWQVDNGPVNREVSAKAWVFGHHSDLSNHNDSWQGLLDDIRIYNRLLGAKEVRLLANVGGISGSVLDNDFDAHGDTLTAILVDDVTNGTLNFNSNGTFSYFPHNSFSGRDSFTYVANGGNADSDLAIVTITVTGIDDPQLKVDP
jgi:serine/threonine protein kinase/uncharacterized coiled-coil protein SlyX